MFYITIIKAFFLLKFISSFSKTEAELIVNIILAPEKQMCCYQTVHAGGINKFVIKHYSVILNWAFPYIFLTNTNFQF